MRKTILATALLSVLGAGSALAADAPASPHTLTGNVGVFSDYRFRGVSQTYNGPALQGGFDYGHSSGFYVGNWNSSISGVQYPNGSSLEMDVYAGFKKEIAGVTVDVGTIYYYYPGTEFNAAGDKADNHEVYLGVGYGPISAKLSYALTDYFGLKSTTAPAVTGALGDSEGTMYAELNFAMEVMPKLTVSAHAGTTMYENYDALDYTDYKVGVAYDLNGFVFGLAYVGNSMDTTAEAPYLAVANGSGKTEDLADGTAVISLSKSF